MVKKITLEAKTRAETNGKAKFMIKNGLIPAVLYGAGLKNKNLKLKRHDFESVFSAAGETHLIDLKVDEADNHRVLVKDVQRDAIKNKIIHIDLYQVDMKKKIEVEVPLHFTGESKAIKELGGTLVKSVDTLNIKCLPEDLIDKIDIDIAVLETYDNAIYVKDIKLSADIEILNNPEDIIAHVMEPAVEEVAPLTAAPEGEAVAAAAEGEGEEEKPADQKVK